MSQIRFATKRFLVSICAASALIFTMASCAGAGGFSNETIRYKMTVTVETPEGIKTGSAVREAIRYTEPSILPDQGGTFYNITKGEAVVVDLGHRGVLFVLIGGEWEARIVFKALETSNKVNMQDLDPLIKKWGAPRFVYFKDMNDPKTVASASYLNLQRDFGYGVSLKQIEVETVNTPASFGNVERLLPWLSERANLPGSIGSDPDSPFKDKTGLWLKSIEFKRGF
ncbi:hypothetical protein [Sphingobium fluviale]|uniref:Uncharacterized protein n=1 Tax=Sphingobium fluviale TaxID=2506423 RepID=A0A4Q1KF22_9SPHN|nr:hypothetical protein [Sphingobium fluviale]RXR28273.1 hypothetical protein EQG66_11025 [Sphingobium fluviale]